MTLHADNVVKRHFRIVKWRNMMLGQTKAIFELQSDESCSWWYPCERCEHQAISKGYLTKHEKAVHDGIQLNVKKLMQDLWQQNCSELSPKVNMTFLLGMWVSGDFKGIHLSKHEQAVPGIQTMWIYCDNRIAQNYHPSESDNIAQNVTQD